MRIHRLVAVGMAGAALAGCGSADGSATTVAPPAESVVPAGSAPTPTGSTLTIPSVPVSSSAGAEVATAGGDPPDDWQSLVSPDLTMGAPAGWKDMKATIASDPITKASVVDQLLASAPGASPAQVEDVLSQFDLWLVEAGPDGVPTSMVIAQADPDRPYPADEGPDPLGTFAKSIANTPPAGVKETIAKATIGGRPVVTVDREPDSLAGKPALKRIYYVLDGQQLVAVTFRTTGLPDYPLWEQMVATLEVAGSD